MIHPAIVMGVIGGIIIFAISLMFSNFLGYADGTKTIRSEAVDRGFAEWVPDKEGNTTFKWKEVAK